jgi:hypothetical protein
VVGFKGGSGGGREGGGDQYINTPYEMIVENHVMTNKRGRIVVMTSIACG